MLSSRQVLRVLRDDGWYQVRQKGSHVQLKHARKSGLVTVPHPKKDVDIKTLKSVERQSGVSLFS